VIGDGQAEVDVDAPIPYKLTALGHREVAQWREERRVADCHHEWVVDFGRGLVCRGCQTVTTPRKLGGIPSYLGLKGHS
jgi:hypothetical protein